MFCPNCGSKTNDSAKVCLNCGKELIPAAAVTPTPLAQPILQSKEAVIVEHKSGGRRLIIIVLCVLLGIVALGFLASIALAFLNNAKQNAPTDLQQNAQSNGGWINYSPDTGTFNATFPSTPEISPINKQGAYVGNRYMALEGNSAFSIYEYAYTPPLNISDSKTFLADYVNVFAGGAKIETMNYTYQGTYPAVDFQITADANDSVKGRAILVSSTTVYMLAEIYTPSEYVDTDYQKFISSFSIK